jgi:ribose transport system permease protein/erythritol transport system permease protein
MTIPTLSEPEAPAPDEQPGAPSPERAESLPARVIRALLTQRIVLLAVLVVLVVVYFMILGANGYLTADYDFDYMSAALINAVPLAMLGFAELIVILSGRGGIDLSVGAIVSLAGMIFGFAYGQWGWPLWLAIVITMLVGAVLGLVNGILVAYIGFPALIATLATYYAYKSLAVVINNQRPISTRPIQDLYDSTARSVQLPVIGSYIPDVPKGIFLFLLPTLVVVWLLLARTTYGRRVYAIGTNDVAARWSAIGVRATRAGAYAISGLISGLVAVVTVGIGQRHGAAGYHDCGSRWGRDHWWHWPSVRNRSRHRADRVDECGHSVGLRRQRRSPVPAARPWRIAGLRGAAQWLCPPTIRRRRITSEVGAA